MAGETIECTLCEHSIVMNKKECALAHSRAAERFYRMETKFPYDKNSACRQYLGVIQLLSENSCMAPSCFCPSQLSKERS